MNNFDDLFEQQPQAEAAPQKQESQKERPKRQWWQIREEKQRKEAYATLDRIFGEFSEGTGSMEAYLDVQSRIPILKLQFLKQIMPRLVLLVSNLGSFLIPEAFHGIPPPSPPFLFHFFIVSITTAL